LNLNLATQLPFAKRPLLLKPSTPPKPNLKNILLDSPSERRIQKVEEILPIEVATPADPINSDLVLITIYPDEQGKFGFNVKGGIDQKAPIIVSRVGANTPAEK